MLINTHFHQKVHNGRHLLMPVGGLTLPDMQDSSINAGTKGMFHHAKFGMLASLASPSVSSNSFGSLALAGSGTLHRANCF